MTKDLLQQALDALERVSRVDEDCDILAPNLSDAVTDSIEALKTALMQPVPMRKTTREEKITRPGVYELPLATATLSTAPACLNTNDKAMWVLGWNECLNAAISSTKETS